MGFSSLIFKFLGSQQIGSSSPSLLLMGIKNQKATSRFCGFSWNLNFETSVGRRVGRKKLCWDRRTVAITGDSFRSFCLAKALAKSRHKSNFLRITRSLIKLSCYEWLRKNLRSCNKNPIETEFSVLLVKWFFAGKLFHIIAGISSAIASEESFIKCLKNNNMKSSVVKLYG